MCIRDRVGLGALEHLVQTPAPRLGRSMAGQAGKGVIDPFDAPLGIGDEHGIGGVGGDQRKPSQLLLRPLALGDVLAGGQLSLIHI